MIETKAAAFKVGDRVKLRDKHVGLTVVDKVMAKAKGPIRANRWYRIKSGPFGGRIMKCRYVVFNSYFGLFKNDNHGYHIHEKNLTRLSYHSSEVQAQINKEIIMNPDSSTCSKSKATPDKKEGRLESKQLVELVKEVTTKNMGDLRTVAASYVGTENNKRIERVKLDLIAATEANIAEIDAIKAGVKQPRKVNWPAIIIGVVGVTTTIVAYVL